LKLFEHPDFDQAIIRAAEYFHSSGMREAVIEKDYYVTEALRIIQQTAGDKVIFKGGTSLSKGWNIIQRFSEDVDIFFDPIAFEPPLGKNAINRELKKLRQAVESHQGLKFIEQESRTIGGFGRSDHFEYVQQFTSSGDIRNYDLYCLAERPEVLAMLRSNEYKVIKIDYDRVSRKHFETDYVAPPDMNFAKSEAIFPIGNIEMILAAEFEKQCRILCFGKFPTWDQVQKRLMSLQRLL